MQTTILKFLADLEREIVNLRRRREIAIEEAQSRLTRDAASRHLGHNLGNTANEISEIDAKIEQTEMIVRDLRTRLALMGEGGAS